MADRKPKAFSVKFSSPPGIGTTIWLKGDEFSLEKVEPYVRRDGEESNLLTWGSWCKACGCEFVQTTGRSFSGLKKNCDDCRSESRRPS